MRWGSPVSQFQCYHLRKLACLLSKRWVRTKLRARFVSCPSPVEASSEEEHYFISQLNSTEINKYMDNYFRVRE